MFRYLKRFSSAFTERERTSGRPTSANGASSFHLVWDVAQTPLVEVEATLEVLVLPAVKSLYFWALQVSFASQRRLKGGAHVGLQFNQRHPGSTAVNWGGYGAADTGGAILSGSMSSLASTPNDPNTRDFDWRAGHRYRLRVARSPVVLESGHAWRGSVTDLETGQVTVVRDLHTQGDHLVAPMVWSEVFARCEAPSVSVRWSDLRGVDPGGAVVVPRTVRVNYQTREDGGCDNTTVAVDELGIVQTTATPRQIPQGAILPVPGARIDE
ncbi:MAG TPA: hypothetical protein VLD62_08570 [Acidimicrobiia bacterium]|nr:hypothetical protein [Acidimicrobiia bacterium]